MECSEADSTAASFKAFLQKSSSRSDRNLYDHLVLLLVKIMDERPHDAVDVLEDMSLELKRALFKDRQSSLREHVTPSAGDMLAEHQLLLFKQEQDFNHEDPTVETGFPNVNETAFYLEQAGVGLGREETQRILLALKLLVESQGLPRCRLWGKILGTESSYIIAEAEYAEGDGEQSADEDLQEEEEEEESGTQESETDPVPRSTYTHPPMVPKEAVGTGANRCFYFVCTEPGLPWVKLPPVSPAQITAARSICKAFTGRLDSPVLSYPPFPGNEANYLRAQIARISAGTQVSPSGFYQAVEEEGEEEEETGRDQCQVNPEFEGVSSFEMAQSLSSWVHHIQHILKQGRCTWVNPAMKVEDDSIEEAEAGEKDERPDEPEPEYGPPLLTNLSQDAELFHTPPWSLRLSSTITPQHAVAVLRSNLWPGAFAFSNGKRFENIYVGWGLKYTGQGYSPCVPPPPQQEYPSGPEVTEMVDPSVEEEEEMRMALEEQQEVQQESEEEEEDEEDDN
ncbi:radial spoke head protein 4 homolog A isoform X2 [Oryzias melastigma]|uniref:Radial spoke head component 4A n=1 Tax=Oryzias melastigma TaxID=30732 RepID=A0A3B3DQJ7_ORYME|nr:radial spoke head protein 4 homolog A isoform X2 [Oryzias melastigma]